MAKNKKKENTQAFNYQNNSEMTGDWFYMNSSSLTAKEIYHLLKANSSNLSFEFWDSCDILEIELKDNSSLKTIASIDFEPMKPYFKDEQGNTFLKEHQINTIYMVTFPIEFYQEVLPILKIITASLGGFFCADTQDFTPQIS